MLRIREPLCRQCWSSARPHQAIYRLRPITATGSPPGPPATLSSMQIVSGSAPHGNTSRSQSAHLGIVAADAAVELLAGVVTSQAPSVALQRVRTHLAIEGVSRPRPALHGR